MVIERKQPRRDYKGSVASGWVGSPAAASTERDKMCPLAGVSQLEPAPRPSRVVKFGLFEVNLEDAELRKSGMRQKLVGQPFEVLRLLLERPQQLVTREELRQRIWPKDTFVDYDLALKKAVNRIREALGDSADSPRFIETIPRQGYRFISKKNYFDVSCQTRRIMTSVAFMRAAAVCPGFSCISRAEVAVMIDVICCPPIEIFISAIRPLIRTESTRPTS
jgi:DNA-binding winged helix-turn-helix (wHTH) protein